jgi:ABC-type oligopeptide transport system substrate-binding subunit
MRQESAYDLGPLLRDDYDMWNMGWGMGLPDPSELASNLFGTGGAANLGGYSNPALDAKSQAALGLADRAARAQSYAEIEAALLEDAPFLFLGVRRINRLHSARLRNFVYDPALWTYWDRYWVADA